jgi:hypothetical protein
VPHGDTVTHVADFAEPAETDFSFSGDDRRKEAARGYCTSSADLMGELGSEV